ncbi:hypothetical protein V5799_009016 [Amblyomma americanum]|uniref:Uncharacterized protein n=1 Tax=Amblyomma americanum TaxID=6943 RepID=A0AAQ4FC96_AMBAM
MRGDLLLEANRMAGPSMKSMSLHQSRADETRQRRLRATGSRRHPSQRWAKYEKLVPASHWRNTNPRAENAGLGQSASLIMCTVWLRLAAMKVPPGGHLRVEGSGSTRHSRPIAGISPNHRFPSKNSFLLLKMTLGLWFAPAPELNLKPRPEWPATTRCSMEPALEARLVICNMRVVAPKCEPQWRQCRSLHLTATAR